MQTTTRYIVRYGSTDAIVTDTLEQAIEKLNWLNVDVFDEEPNAPITIHKQVTTTTTEKVSV